VKNACPSSVILYEPEKSMVYSDPQSMIHLLSLIQKKFSSHLRIRDFAISCYISCAASWQALCHSEKIDSIGVRRWPEL
jgi:hypothetical protein